MNFTKKIVTALVLIAFSVALIPPICAKAALLDIEVTPDGEGTVSISMNITNDSENTMTDIVLDINGSQYPINQSVEVGSSLALDMNGYFIGGEPNVVIKIVMTWQENGEAKSLTKEIPYSNGAEPTPTVYSAEELVTFSCSVDNPRAEKGQTVTLRYKVTNNSDKTAEDVVIIDSGISDAPIVSGKSIPADETGNFKYEFAMGDHNLSTSPSLTFTIDGKMSTISGDSITIECVTIDMDVSVVQKESGNDGTEFVIKLANNGNKPISDIRIINSQTNEQLDGGIDLPSGETKDLSYIFKPKGKQTVSFKVTGRLATGKTYEYESKSYDIWEYIDPSTIGLEFNVTVAEALKDGYVGIDITVKNIGSEDMKQISVSEEKIGRIANFSDLVGGGEETQSILPYIGDARDMNFTLKGYARTGEPYEYKLTVSAQAVSLGTNSDTVEGFDVNSLDVGGTVSGILKKILTVLSIMSFVAGAALIVFAVFEKQQDVAMGKK